VAAAGIILRMRTRALGGVDFEAGVGERWFEDYRAGAVYEYGHLEVGEAEMLEFAQRFDPQPIHVDPAYAAAGPFGGLIGSGWHSAGLAMRLLADHYLSRVASLASPGVDELRWRVPLRPGDTVHLRTTIHETRPSRSKPDRGIVITDVELINQHDGRPISFRAMNLLRRRP
jgi:acyl dehydratase